MNSISSPVRPNSEEPEAGSLLDTGRCPTLLGQGLARRGLGYVAMIR
jgi:hypothetical protein